MMFRLKEIERCVSTNELLMRAPLTVHPIGTALLAHEQSAGRGRAGRSWISPKGGLYLSVLIKTRAVDGLAILGAYCGVRLCREVFGLPAQIRWPNDVYLKGRKLAGVLPQARFCGETIERAVLGIGWNIVEPSGGFLAEIAEKATSLSHHLPPSRLPTPQSLAEALLPYLSQELEALERDGTEDLCRRAVSFLEGLSPAMEAYVSSPCGERPVGRVRGLGPAGELLVGETGELSRLETEERLLLRPTSSPTLPPTSPHC